MNCWHGQYSNFFTNCWRNCKIRMIERGVRTNKSWAKRIRNFVETSDLNKISYNGHKRTHPRNRRPPHPLRGQVSRERLQLFPSIYPRINLHDRRPRCPKYCWPIVEKKFENKFTKRNVEFRQNLPE